MTLLGILGSVCAVAYLVILIGKGGLSFRYVRTHPETATSDLDVTILQPILGGDPFLETALRSNLTQTNPEVRFLWLMDEDDIPGNAAVQHVLQSASPEQSARVTVLNTPPCPLEFNPKTWKLHFGLSSVETTSLAVLDDDTMLGEGQLGRALGMLEHYDLYTGLPHYQNGETFWSSLIAHFVNNNSILTYFPLLVWMKPITINGMFYCVKTDTLRGYGGFQPILKELCDDYALARHLRKQRGTLYQGVSSQSLRTSVSSSRRYLEVMHRWFLFANVLLLDQPLLVRVNLIVLLGLPPLLLWGSLGLLREGLTGVLGLALLLIFRHVLIRLLHRRMFSERLHFSAFLSIASELLQIVHAFHALLSRDIIWRRHRIRVRRDGTFVKLRGDES